MFQTSVSSSYNLEENTSFGTRYDLCMHRKLMSKPNPHVENLVFSESVQLGWEWDGMGFTMGMESPLTTALKIVH